jgi:beta-lactamase regulating signal transducer with metallopeptidase domain/biopolymer transport protein ExbD
MNTLIETISHYLQNSAFTALFFDAWLKSLAVLAVAGGMCLLLRRAAAATRHWIWFLALASLPWVLLLACVPHSWQSPLWSVSTGFNSGNQVTVVLNLAPTSAARSAANGASPSGAAAAAANEGATGNSQPFAARFTAGALVLAVVIWLVGAGLGLVSMLAGRVQLRRLARNGLLLAWKPHTFEAGAPAWCRLRRSEYSKPAICRRSEPPEADWALLLQETRDRLRLRRPVRLLQSADNPMPLTWGWWRPVILLPAEAASWPSERRRIVLLHKLAHAKRWDCLTQTVARMVCALYWINPLVWLAARRMCIERERACDDLVLNSGCRPSEYATHLVDIARAFRRAPQLAGIAMARSPQLQGRIAAIVDASRARQLRPLTAVAILVFMGVLALSVGGRTQDASSAEPWDSPLRQAQFAQLESFAQAKLRQSQELAAKAGEQISPRFQGFFNAAIKGDWQTVTNLYMFCKQHHPQYSNGTNVVDESLRTAYWQPVLEIDLAYDLVLNCEPKYTALFADGIINSIPAGSIYFGGTDPGRGLPTAFSKSQVNGDPFFTLTQNALADGTYLDYLRAMYGGKIYIPTGEDSQRCYQEYTADAMRRGQEHKLRPGEDVKMVDGKAQISGVAAVTAIDGQLTKVVFDRNTNQEFYIEESFPFDWMYPYLEPHGLIMKMNRQPLAQMPEDTIARDREYWRKLAAGMIGDWLNEKTTVREVAEFVDRVYVRKNLKGFTGDPRFIQNHYAKATFSKLRSSIAGVYAWRLGPVTPPEYLPRTQADKQALVTEADFAFRQAFALCPYSPEAIFRYVSFLLPSNRLDDAKLIAEAGLKADPQNKQVQSLLENLKSFKAQQGRVHVEEPTNNLASLEEPVRRRLTNPQAALADASQSEKTDPKPVPHLLVSIDPNGVLRLGADATIVTTERFKAELLAAVGKTPDLRLDISADRNAPFAQMIRVTDAAKKANIKSVGLRTLPEKPAPTSALTGAQAEAKAVELANEKAQALYNCQPFQKGRPAELVDGHWVWNDGRPYGAADLEATVKFAADGTNPELTVTLSDSRP